MPINFDLEQFFFHAAQPERLSTNRNYHIIASTLLNSGVGYISQDSESSGVAPTGSHASGI